MAYDEVDRKEEPVPMIVVVCLTMMGLSATVLFTTFCIAMTATIARSMWAGLPQ